MRYSASIETTGGGLVTERHAQAREEYPPKCAEGATTGQHSWVGERGILGRRRQGVPTASADVAGCRRMRRVAKRLGRYTKGCLLR